MSRARGAAGAPLPSREARARGLLVLVAGIVLGWLLRVIVLQRADATFDSVLEWTLWTGGLKALLWALPALAYTRVFLGIDPARHLGARTLPAPAVWLQSVLLAAACAGFSLLVQPAGLATGGGYRALLVLLLSTLPGALFEELLFRGLLLAELRVFAPPALALTASALLSTSMHLPRALWAGIPGSEVAIAAAVLMATGLAAGWLRLRSGSLWPCVVLHALAAWLPWLAG